MLGFPHIQNIHSCSEIKYYRSHSHKYMKQDQNMGGCAQHIIRLTHGDQVVWQYSGQIKVSQAKYKHTDGMEQSYDK